MRHLRISDDKLIPVQAGLWLLGLGNFAVGTGIMAIPGMLNELSTDLAISSAAVGMLIAAFALTVSIAGPPLSGWTSNMDRRTLLTAALSLYATMHLAAALVPNYAAFLTTRILAAAGAALFAAQTSVAVAAIVHKEVRGKAIGLVLLGGPAAAVIGKPLSSYLGACIGWRPTLVLIGMLSCVFAAGIWRTIPEKVFVAPIDRTAWRSLFAHVALLMTIVVTFLQALGMFAVLSYKAWLLKELIDATPAAISLLFMCFGITAVLGNLVAAMVMDKIGPVLVGMIGMGCMLVAIALWPLARGSFALSGALTAIWGLGGFSVNSAQQVRLIAMAPALAPVTAAMNSSAIYLGQAIGTLMGGLIVQWQGVVGLSTCGVAFIAVAMALSLTIARR